MSAAPVIIIITRPTRPANVAEKADHDGKQVEIQLIGHENSTDYEILLAAAAQLENADK